MSLSCERLIGEHDTRDAHSAAEENLPKVRVTTLQFHDPVMPDRGRFLQGATVHRWYTERGRPVRKECGPASRRVALR